MKSFNWMPILKTGTFVAKNGKKVNFSEEDLDRIIENTDLSKEPQFVVEHPHYDKLGFGTIAALKRVGKYLFALPKKVDKKFKDAVNRGELPGRSVSLDAKTLSLNHIGFLPPDVAPAVDGLGTYNFSSGDSHLSIMLPGIESHFADVNDNHYEFASSDENKKIQEARSSKYKISIKENGHVTKPSEYSNLGDEDFADPVNYKYPIDEEHIRAALSYWAMEKNRKDYTDDEIKIITKRILKAAEKYGIEIDKDKWEFSMEISRWPFQNIKNLFRNLKNAWIEKFGKEEADNVFPEFDLDETGNPPIILNDESTINNLSTFKRGDNMGKIDLSKYDFSKVDPELKAALEYLQNENEELSVKLQDATQTISAAQLEKNKSEVLAFCESPEMKLKILPAEKDKIVSLLLAVKEKGNLEFSSSDGTAKIQFSAYEYLKDLLKHLPDRIELSEIATKQNAGDNKLTDYQKLGKEIASFVNPKKN